MIPFDFVNRYSDVLKPLGLSDYEIKVFLTLLSKGPLNYRALCQESGVPAGRIYQVLSALESKGFVEDAQDKPKIFRAAEPKRAFKKRLRQLEDDFFDLEQKTREALRSLQLQYSLKNDFIQGVVSDVVVGNCSFADSLKVNLLRAEEEILVSIDDLADVLKIDELLKEILKKGVSIKVLADNSSGKGQFFDRLVELGVSVRVLDFLPSRYFVVDDKNVSLIIGGLDAITCLQIHGASLCRVFRESFSSAWNSAKPLNSKPHTIASKFRLFE